MVCKNVRVNKQALVMALLASTVCTLFFFPSIRVTLSFESRVRSRKNPVSSNTRPTKIQCCSHISNLGARFVFSRAHTLLASVRRRGGLISIQFTSKAQQRFLMPIINFLETRSWVPHVCLRVCPVLVRGLFETYAYRIAPLLGSPAETCC